MAPNCYSLPPIKHFSGSPPRLPAFKQVVACSGDQIATEGFVQLLKQQKFDIDDQINRRIGEGLARIFSCNQLLADETTISCFWTTLAGMQSVGSVHDLLTFVDSKIPFDHFDTCYRDENNKLNNSFSNNFSKQRSIDVILNFHIQKMQLVIKMIDSEISWAEKEWNKQFIKRLGSINYFDIKSSEIKFQADLNKYTYVMFNLLYAREFLNRVLTSGAIPSDNYPDVFGAMTNGIDMTYTEYPALNFH
jgi:hypothetical protein